MAIMTEAFRASYVASARPREARSSVVLSVLGTVVGVVAGTLVRLRRELLTVAGFACLAASAWTFALWAGLAATGVALLVLEFLTSDAGETRR